MRGVFCYNDWGAGFNDRKEVIRSLLRWAWLLNAQVNLPPPCRLLTPQHNFHIPLDCNFTWDRYITLEPQHLLTTKPCSLEFGNFYDISVKMLADTPVRVGFSPFVAQETVKLSQEMNLPIQYDFIHIRRTDSTHECDTNVLRMKHILKSRSFNTRHVVYATDESDEKYNGALIEVLEKRNLTVYRTKKWLQNRFPQDNYMMFSIEQYLFDHAIGKHQWRRKFSCPSQ